MDKVLIREDQNLVDDKGNTVLHIATKEVRTQPIVRYSIHMGSGINFRMVFIKQVV